MKKDELRLSDTLLGFVDVEFGYIQEKVSLAPLAEFCFKAVRLDEAFEVSLVGHLSEVHGADIFQNGLDMLHQASHNVLFLHERQQEVDFSSFGQSS